MTRIASKTRRGARVVESGGLENRYRSNPIEGSNPSLSADNRKARMAELADALYSGCSVLTDVQVQLLFRAPERNPLWKRKGFFVFGGGEPERRKEKIVRTMFRSAVA